MTMKDKKVTISPTPRSQRRLPWWVSVLLAIGSYCSLKFVVPGLQLTSPTWQKLAQAAPTFAPLVTIPFLLLAAKQLYDVNEDGRENQDDEPDNSQDNNPEQ
jgi:hypothetical protein